MDVSFTTRIKQEEQRNYHFIGELATEMDIDVLYGCIQILAYTAIYIGFFDTRTKPLSKGEFN